MAKQAVSIFLACLLSTLLQNAQSLSKYEKWQQPSYFRGFNVGYYCQEGECVREQQDLYNLKNTGANLAQISVYGESFRHITYPYAINNDGKSTITEMVNFCKKADLYYTIAVRVGPGRYDVSDDELISYVWHKDSTYAVSMYGKMLKEIAKEFLGDTLFVGLNMTVEPNPHGEEYLSPDELDDLFIKDKIDLHKMYKTWIDSVRTIDPNLPLIVQAAQFSDPEYWGNSLFLKKQEDPYIVYDFHTYQPFNEYTHADVMNSATYPISIIWSETKDDYATWDSAFYSNTVFSKVKAFQTSNNVPILMGEFGMMQPQKNGEKYLNDLYEIAIANEWHFALWCWQADKDISEFAFNYERFDNASPGSNYWQTVLNMFKGAGVTSINKVNPEKTLVVYPNPTNKYLNLDLKEKGMVELIDINGQLLFHNNYDGFLQIDVSNYPKGFYFLRVSGKDINITEKVIKY